jgi:hypothetical protein
MRSSTAPPPGRLSFQGHVNLPGYAAILPTDGGRLGR